MECDTSTEQGTQSWWQSYKHLVWESFDIAPQKNTAIISKKFTEQTIRVKIPPQNFNSTNLESVHISGYALEGRGVRGNVRSFFNLY